MSKLMKILISIVAVILIALGVMYYMLVPSQRILENTNLKLVSYEDFIDGDFIESAQITKNPLGVKGTIKLDENDFKNIIYTVIEKNNIDDLRNATLWIKSNQITLVSPYKVMGFIDSQYEVDITPKVNQNNIELTLTNLKLGKINLNDKNINSVLSTYKKNIPFNVDKNTIIINKDKTYPIIVDNIEIDGNNILLDVNLKVVNILDFIKKYGLDLNLLLK